MLQGSDLPLHLAHMVEQELDPNEKVQWVGQPRPGRFMAAGLFMSIFGLIFAGFALFWILTAMNFGQNGFGGVGSCFPLFGIPFLLVGIGLLFSPIWLRKNALNTVYVITEKRAILFEKRWSMNIRSFGPEKLHDIERRQRGDGSGDLILARELRWSHGGQHHHSGYRTYEVGFFGIENAKEVEQMLRALRDRA